MKNSLYITPLVAMLSTLSVNATESEVTPFIGVKAGYQWAYDNAYHHDQPSDTFGGVYGGLQFSPEWSWDLGYQLGSTYDFDKTDTKIQTALIESAIRYDWSLDETSSLYGRLGAAYWDMDKYYATGSQYEKGLSPLGEVGYSYKHNENIYLNAGYQYIHQIGDSSIGEYNNHGLLVGLTYRFGSSTKSAPVQTKAVAPAPAEKVVETKAAPVVPVVVTKTYTKTEVDAVNFDFDSAETNDRSASIIDVMQTYPQATVQIIGHTDSQGSEKYNQKLSEKRAQDVADKFIAAGIDSSRITVLGKGESEPLVANDTLVNKAKNRRVQIVVPEFEYEVQE